MKYGGLVLEKKDYVMIIRHRAMSHFIEDYSHKDMLERLAENMVDAVVYNREDMPDDVIRLYSWTTVSSAAGWRETFQVVLPYEKDIKKDMISVQSGLGASVIGRAEGDLVHYGTPNGIIPLKIERVVQSGGYIKEHIPEDTYEKLLSEQQRTFLPRIDLELS